MNSQVSSLAIERDELGTIESTTHELNLVPKLYQKSVIEKIRTTDWHKGSNAPFIVELDPTTACNLACPDCISGSLLNQGGFSNERLLSLSQELIDSGVRAVVLIGGGEPLSHAAIGKVIELFGQHKVQLGLTTNGILIPRYQQVIAQYVNWVRVSMDAGTSATFAHVRPSRTGKSMFDKIIKNMRVYAKVKQGKLGYSFLMLSEFDRARTKIKFTNVNEIFQAAKLAKEIGCDYFEVKPSFDMEHFHVEQPKEVLEMTEEQWHLAKQLEDESFQVLGATNLFDRLDNDSKFQKKNYDSCPVSQLRTLITPSGVFPCPYFRGVANKQLGSTVSDSFVSVWQGDKRKNIMNDLKPSKDCGFHCIRHQTNEALFKLMKNTNGIKPVDDYNLFF